MGATASTWDIMGYHGKIRAVKGNPDGIVQKDENFSTHINELRHPALSRTEYLLILR